MVNDILQCCVFTVILYYVQLHVIIIFQYAQWNKYGHNVYLMENIPMPLRMTLK